MGAREARNGIALAGEPIAVDLAAAADAKIGQRRTRGGSHSSSQRRSESVSASSRFTLS